MTTPIVRRESHPTSPIQWLRDAARWLVAPVLAMLLASAVGAQTTATFTLQDQTNLTGGTYQIYVTGFSTPGPYVLQPDGSWGAPAAPVPPALTAALPCYRYPQDISQVQISNAQTAISARVYYFVVTDQTRFPSCNPVFRNLGTCPGVTMTATTITMASGSAIPPGGCTIVAPVASATSGTVVNTTSSLQTSGGIASPASAPLTVGSGSGPTLVKSLASSTISSGGNTTLTLTLGNPGATGLSLTSDFTDPMPTGVTTTGNSSGTCPGVTVTANTITMANGSTIPPGFCNIVVPITSSTSGTVVNTTSALQTSGGNAPAASAPLTVGSGSGPTLIKAFAVSTIASGNSTTLTLTLGNPGATPLTLTAPFTDTMPTGVSIAQPGLFNLPNAFTYTSAAALNLSAPSVAAVTGKSFPAWTFSEIGASSSVGTIDLSQVDFFAFPMNTTATVTSNTPPNPAVIGNPVGATDNPGDAVNHLSIRDSYSAFVNALAEAGNGNKSCSTDSTPIECAYLDLLQDITTAGSAVPQYVVQNPGGFLGQNSAATQASRLNTAFDVVIGKLWAATGAPTLTIDTGGALGGTAAPPVPAVPQDVFTSSIVTLTYPGSSPSYSIKAMKFTGAATGYVAYVFSPKEFETGCNAIPSPIPAGDCSAPASAGYQVFAGAGALGTPSTTVYTNFGSSLPAATTAYGSIGYVNVVGRLAFLVSAAMNRGVAMVNCSQTYTWQCWQNETYWYPTRSTASDPASIFPDITQNLFSQWMHTATIGGTPMFIRPPNAVKSASSTPGGGTPMGMAYGFGSDENPTPPATSPAQPEVPSKMDQTVVFGGGGPYTITFGPWVTQSANPTLSVAKAGAGTGTVTSSPAGINCGADCSQAFPAGTSVILTANPADGSTFGGWSGGSCSGTGTTCAFTLNGTTNVDAEFDAYTPGPSFALEVYVSGAGSVRSGPPTPPPAIDCGTTCTTPFPASTVVTLTAYPGPGATFRTWSGPCTGSSTTCQVTMSQASEVTASFVAINQYALTVTGWTGGGIATTIPAGIDCGSTCTAGFTAGTAASVIAQPHPGYRFVGWTGACTGSSTCDLMMSADRAVQATFAAVTPGQYALTIHDFGEGTVTSFPAGISCAPNCSAVFAAGTEVTLTAAAGNGYSFGGWGGACSGVGSCVVTMNDLEFVSVTFEQNPAKVPTLSEWVLLLLGLLLAGLAGRQLLRPTRMLS